MKQLTSESVTEFDLTTEIGQGTEEPTGTSFDVELSDRWVSLGGIHGGYMAAIATHGAEAVVPDRSVRTVTTSFQRSGRVAPARLHVEEVRRGSSVSTVVAELSQRGRVVISSRITLLAGLEGLDWGDRRVVAVAPVADCVPITRRIRSNTSTERTGCSTRPASRSAMDLTPRCAVGSGRSTAAVSTPPGSS